jgi:hypothetical protein
VGSLRHWSVPVALLLASAGCGSGSPASPTPLSSSLLSGQVISAMETAIADEYRAETIYQGVVNDFGPLAPFTNVIGAEQRHSASIAALFTSRGLAVPGNRETVATVPHFTSVREACGAAAVEERDNIAMYDRLLPAALPSDVSRVFQTNRTASLANHLPAFERCS